MKNKRYIDIKKKNQDRCLSGVVASPLRDFTVFILSDHSKNLSQIPNDF